VLGVVIRNSPSSVDVGEMHHYVREVVPKLSTAKDQREIRRIRPTVGIVRALSAMNTRYARGVLREFGTVASGRAYTTHTGVRFCIYSWVRVRSLDRGEGREENEKKKSGPGRELNPGPPPFGRPKKESYD